ncbi:hypothetical protein YC2023_082106 [Brassica napus]|uniref:Uncharacterized protein n=1 Tax=Brassica oleracea TaxID=3712 RepID=A0A3P6ETN2_BRAOL|nr:unnamed protein product [Brassica oleracea]
MGYMEIGDDPGFIAVCYCDHEADEESEIEASIDTQPEISIDEKLVAMINSAIQPPIDNDHGESIDNSHASEIFVLPEHCYPSFAVNTQTPTSIDYQYDDTIDR